MRPFYFCLFILPSVLLSCVSTGKFKAMQQQALQFDSLYTQSERTLKNSQEENKNLGRQKATLQDQFNDMSLQMNATKENNIQLRRQLQDLSAISSAQAESIKKSLDNMGAKDNFIHNLQSAVAHRDSVNLAVLMNLKAVLGSYGDQDVNIKVANGTVYVDLSDKLLFNSDTISYTVTDRGKGALARLARVFNDLPGVDFMVEGHTDGPNNTASTNTHNFTDSTAIPNTHNITDSTAIPNTHNIIDSTTTKTSTTSTDSTATTTSTDSTATTTSLAIPDSLLHLRNPLLDNWEPSVKRAATIVRILQHDYNVSPARMTAAGRGEFIPVAPNDNPEGRAANRRTRIVIFPHLDKIMRLLERRQEQAQAQPPAKAAD